MPWDDVIGLFQRKKYRNYCPCADSLTCEPTDVQDMGHVSKFLSISYIPSVYLYYFVENINYSNIAHNTLQTVKFAHYFPKERL